jgi:hypothetical protein
MELNPGLPWQKAAFNKKKACFTTQLLLRKKPINCCIWSIAFYGAENWTFRKVDQKWLGILNSGAGVGWRV